MVDNRRNPEDRKPLGSAILRSKAALYIAPLTIAGIIVAIGLVIAVRQKKAAPAPVAKTAQVSIQPRIKPVIAAVIPPPLDRQGLIENERRVASAFAADGKMPSGKDPLIGRRFSIAIPFGCNGVQDGSVYSQFSTSFDVTKQTITLTATPNAWLTLPLIQALPDVSNMESVEGFWIPRPWINAETCPAKMDYPVPVTPTPATAPTLGLAQLFPSGGSRVVEHASNPYQFTRQVPKGDASLLSHTYRLVLEGIISGFADGQSLSCWAEALDHAPVCLFAVQLDRVSLEDATSGEALANWTQ
jgi:hypothetical protein